MKRLEWSLLSEDNSARILFAFSPSTAHNLCVSDPPGTLSSMRRGPDFTTLTGNFSLADPTC